MILIFGALLAVYVFCRAILPLKLKWGWKLLLAALLAVAAFKFHLLHLFGGPMFFSPVLPENVLLAAAWLFSVLFLFFSCCWRQMWCGLCICWFCSACGGTGRKGSASLATG